MRCVLSTLIWSVVLLAGLRGCPKAIAEDVTPPGARAAWEEAYQARLRWWSLQPLVAPAIPDPPGPTTLIPREWAANGVDAFIAAKLAGRGLRPAVAAPSRVLARRLAFALTGLPPDPAWVEEYAAEPTPESYQRLVTRLLDSPHFGERWARHWLDVVHYSDTHGYEWDTPAKNAWRYRDYVVRAFNQDLPIQRFLLEQIAGDLLEPRVDAESGLNEAMLGPMALRLGERRHGDNAAAEGVTQEAMANIIDTVGKGFLATTVACAQCHDHKLDAVEQRDYYALSGVFMNTRWVARSAEGRDPNPPVIERLREQKQALKSELAKEWLAAREGFAAQIRRWPGPGTNAPSDAFPEALRQWWQRSQGTPPTREEYQAERARRIAENGTNLVLIADFTREDGAPGWRWEGLGMKHGLVEDGECVVTESGERVLVHLLPAGRWSHAWSMRLAGAVRSPLLATRPAWTLSVEMAAGRHAGEAFIVDQAFHSERMQFPNLPKPAWRSLKAGDFDTLEGGVDVRERRVYLEWATKSLNNYFPPRTGYGGVQESDLDDEASWFGLTRLYRHAPGRPPRDELGGWASLYDDESGDWADRLGRRIARAVERWAEGSADAIEVRMLNDALDAGLLPNVAPPGTALSRHLAAYREIAARLQPDRTIGSAEEWAEAQDERLGVRGSYTTLGAPVPRGGVRFLGGTPERSAAASSGRLEFARSTVSDRNPLTARVFVNRVWLHLFGEGLVRTPDDFGHLGETPSHPELLDHLATRFVADGWSLKRLIRYLVSSATWQQDSRASAEGVETDPENRLWHHMPLRRLEAEAIRDAILAVSGRLDPTLYGPPLNPPRTGEDPAKRLFSGPLEGEGRRSLYLKMTLMEPPRFLALFNQPIPKLTTGRRDVTSVPNQALALLNDPLVSAMAKHWAERTVRDGASTPEVRAEAMITRALGRPASAEEVARAVVLVRETARIRDPAVANDPMRCVGAWQDLAHALFNLKEFIHVR
ncbi:MAG: DUF1553 domain-containing protein [Verrucomicrobiales bacterium]|nr:DUF1553 domain-containing protein [Verrucomicrobiales bacterium]